MSIFKCTIWNFMSPQTDNRGHVFKTLTFLSQYIFSVQTMVQMFFPFYDYCLIINQNIKQKHNFESKNTFDFYQKLFRGKSLYYFIHLTRTLKFGCRRRQFSYLKHHFYSLLFVKE